MTKSLIAIFFAFCFVNFAFAENGAISGASLTNRHLNERVALIHSKSDLENYLKLTPSGRSAFRHLSLTNRKIFLDSLVFANAGVGSYNYDVLVSNLKINQVRDILALFGLQDQTAMLFASPNSLIAIGADKKDHMCNTSTGQCTSSPTDICTSNCKVSDF